MFSWLRLLIEAISFGVSVLGTEWGIGWICQCLHSWTSSLHFCLYEKCGTSCECRMEGKELACGTLKPCPFWGPGQSSPTYIDFPFQAHFIFLGSLQHQFFLTVSESEKSKVKAHSVVTAYFLYHRQPTSWVTDGPLPRSQIGPFPGSQTGVLPGSQIGSSGVSSHDGRCRLLLWHPFCSSRISFLRPLPDYIYLFIYLGVGVRKSATMHM